CACAVAIVTADPADAQTVATTNPSSSTSSTSSVTTGTKPAANRHAPRDGDSRMHRLAVKGSAGKDVSWPQALSAVAAIVSAAAITYGALWARKRFTLEVPLHTRADATVEAQLFIWRDRDVLVVKATV